MSSCLHCTWDLGNRNIVLGTWATKTLYLGPGQQKHCTWDLDNRNIVLGTWATETLYLGPGQQKHAQDNCYCKHDNNYFGNVIDYDNIYLAFLTNVIEYRYSYSKRIADYTRLLSTITPFLVVTV